ncbi:unnamed protein product (macronuclear) [Paramecium tetraurelia]|uniref:Uncharacterized protein n=1 Tax=Paramecium tetraurelia TaxID=5888 RepID=A0DIC1_PARTE|nr:uncharacterized protein GSPATT00017160001 [Paramecium tetraurelia]CAK82788.1 unnamed protein product [Paramecium tetraurelia]|eukprot:XP_001450185.1 hypothetical protein (macronuclear) [Paramecium tetraurelia strain d4-2]
MLRIFFNSKKVQMDEESLTREQVHEAYEAQVSELNEATVAVDDAQVLLQILNNPYCISEEIPNSSSKIELSIKSGSKTALFLKALITFDSSQDFQEKGVLSEIVDYLNEFRYAFLNSIIDLSLQEAQDQEEFKARIEKFTAVYLNSKDNLMLTMVI